jgi:hypothetical protein
MTFPLLCLDFLQIVVQSIQPLFPEMPVTFGPLLDLFQRAPLDPAASELGIASLRNQACPLKHAKVLRDARLAHCKWLGKFTYRALAQQQTTQDGSPRGIGERRECAAEWIGHKINHSVN